MTFTGPFPKVKRVVNKVLLHEMTLKYCAVGYTSHIEPVCGHHIKSKGSGGGDLEINLVPLCTKHHSEIHSIGAEAFLKKHGMRISPRNRWKIQEHIRNVG